jgi:FkbM family methyltransferase
MVRPMAQILAAIPPSWLRAIPWLPARRLALGGLNAALKEAPRAFETETRFGFRVGGTTRDLIQRHLYVFGIWEPDATAAIQSFLHENATVVDVGANVGYFSLLAALAVGRAGVVHSIEALPSTVQLLRRNVALNDASNVMIHPVAAGDTSGEVEMFRAKDAFLGSSSTKSGESSEGLVPLVTLDGLLQEVDGAAVSLLKIDVEGDGAAVLRGARRILGQMPSRSAVLVELTPEDFSRGKEDGESALELMSRLGFTASVVPNEYSARRYADARVKPPRPLNGQPVDWTDVLFVKR